MNYILNKVDGFDPFSKIGVAVDKDGKEIVKSDGKPLKYMSTAAKIEWFRRVYPRGCFTTRAINVGNVDDGIIVRFQAEVYFDVNDTRPVSTWQHQEIVYDHSDWNKAVSKVQTVALGKALSRAGFGCEIENMLDLNSDEETLEFEAEPETKPKKKGRPKKVQKELSKESSDNTELTEIEALIDSIETTIAEEKSEEESVEEPKKDSETDKELEVAYNTIIKCLDGAAPAIARFDGMTIKETLSFRPNICQSICSNEKVKMTVSEEVRAAADYIVNHG